MNKQILVNEGIFAIYLCLCSTLLLNTAGGADIAFGMSFMACLFIHSAVMLFRVLKNGEMSSFVGFLTVIACAGLFAAFNDQYMNLMWLLATGEAQSTIP